MKAIRIIGLDVGDARTGVAISDPLSLSAQPLTTIEAKTLAQCLGQLKEIIEKNTVSEIVIGLPRKLDGSLAEQGQRVLKFHSKLQRYLDSFPEFASIKLSLWDERLSTAQAQRVLSDSKLKNKEKSAALDRVSAAIILDSYLQAKSQNNNN
ncbi:MAG: Holliday junction resolvase RuvX [Deltaproteobacteria bacterium]|nr:Holliday junction resolvase RuvX [Deltaproteobacteria bacterium]